LKETKTSSENILTQTKSKYKEKLTLLKSDLAASTEKVANLERELSEL
jgi:hypothetical protein